MGFIPAFAPAQQGDLAKLIHCFHSSWKQSAPSVRAAGCLREGEEEEGGILHPGFVHDHLGTVLPGQRSCLLHGTALEDPDTRWRRILPGKWVSRKMGTKSVTPWWAGTQPPPQVFLHCGEKYLKE